MASHFTFHGGVLPPTRKTLSNRAPLRQASLPSRVILPLGQHIGAAAQPVVRVGQRVRTGELIARAQGMISAPVHASISGTISAIQTYPVPHPAGGEARCIEIEGDDRDERLTMTPLNWRVCRDDEVIARLQEAGIVGLGGAGFPSAVKARVRERHAIDTLIVNAAECEPYITADDLTLRHYAADVLDGARLLAQVSGAQRVLVGIEDDKPEAAAALQAVLDASSDETLPITLHRVPTRYPSGGEKQLIKLLTDREVPSRGLPADIGVLCHNPGTLLAAIRAVRDGEPLISRVVTLTGEALERPGNVEARLGTPIKDLLTGAGLHTHRLARLVMGGPMMGFALESLALPILKTSNCLIAGSIEEFPPAPAEQPCIRCGACEAVCPASLLPQQLYWFAKGREHDKAELFNLFDCIECAACDYVCPSHIPLVEHYRKSKDEIRVRRQEARRAEHARHRFEFRQARLAREEAEKDAKRLQRAQALKRPRDASALSLATPPAPTSERTQSASVAPASRPPSQPQIRNLKIAQAAARAAVKKAEKALARCESGESDAGQLADLETQLATAREHLQTVETRLTSAQADDAPAGDSPTPATRNTRVSASGDSAESRSAAEQTAHDKALKQRRIAVAAAQAAQRKAQKTWETLDANSDPQVRDAARQKLERTTANLERAQAAIGERQTGPQNGDASDSRESFAPCDSRHQETET
ncbi:electron transport complex subunit RsxC [Halomonas sp. WWR20]